MSRRERLRAYWDARIPPSASFYLADAARAINRGFERPMVSRRTLQRRAAEGRLPVIGGPERAVREYKVLREDLIQFLCDLDLITGSEPPAPRPLPDRRPKPEPPVKQPAPPKAPPPRATGRYEQTKLFD